MQLPVMLSIFVDQLGDFHIIAAILRDFCEPAVLEPADRLQTFRRLFHTERRRRD